MKYSTYCKCGMEMWPSQGYWFCECGNGYDPLMCLWINGEGEE